jgi:hypothetical protein
MEAIVCGQGPQTMPHQLALLLHQAQLQHLGLDLDVISVGLRAR